MPDIRVSPDNTEGKKGTKIYSGTYKGQKIRVAVPSGVTAEEDIRPFFEKEFQRREKSKEVVKPVEGSGYPAIDYAGKVIGGIPSAAGRLLEGTGQDQFGYDFLGVKGGEPEPYQHMTVEQMPIVKAIHGNLSPEEGSDVALNMLLMAAGGRFGENQGPTRFRTGLARASQSYGRSPVGRVLGGVTGGIAGAEASKALGLPAYYGGAAGYKIGDLIGNRAPSAIRAFRRGYNEPIARPAPAAAPVRTPTASQYGIPQGLPAPSTGPYPAGAGYQQPPMPSQGIPPNTAPALPVPTPTPQLGPATSIQMPPASYRTPYSRTPISPVSGMTVSPQMKLPLVQEGANIPPSRQLGPGFTEKLQNLKTATEPETTTQETPKETSQPKGKITLPEVKKFATASNASLEDTIKQFEDSGIKVTRGPKIKIRRRK